VAKKTAKGVPRTAIKKDLTHQLYHKSLFEHEPMNNTVRLIRSIKHQVWTIQQTKKSLCPADDKRYILDDGYTTRAHGHWQNEVCNWDSESEMDVVDESSTNSISDMDLSSDSEIQYATTSEEEEEEEEESCDSDIEDCSSAVDDDDDDDDDDSDESSVYNKCVYIL
jgi:hypothetical protein